MSTFKTNVIAANLTITLNGGNGQLTVPVEIVETVEWYDDGDSNTEFEISEKSWESLRAKYGLKSLCLWGWQNKWRHMMAFGRI